MLLHVADHSSTLASMIVPFGQLCQLQQGEKNKDVPALSIRTLPAIQTAFASSEGNCSGELLKSLPTSEKLCKDKKS